MFWCLIGLETDGYITPTNIYRSYIVISLPEEIRPHQPLHIFQSESLISSLTHSWSENF